MEERQQSRHVQEDVVVDLESEGSRPAAGGGRQVLQHVHGLDGEVLVVLDERLLKEVTVLGGLGSQRRLAGETGTRVYSGHVVDGSGDDGYGKDAVLDLQRYSGSQCIKMKHLTDMCRGKKQQKQDKTKQDPRSTGYDGKTA